MNISFHIMGVEKCEWIKLKYIERRKEIKIRAAIEEIENRSVRENINKDNSQFFEEIGNIDYPLATLIFSVGVDWRIWANMSRTECGM